VWGGAGGISRDEIPTFELGVATVQLPTVPAYGPLQVAIPFRSLGVGVRLARRGATMRILRAVLAAAVCCAPAPSLALEGSAAAGPIGGTDIRSSLPLPPGLYGGMVFVYAEASQFNDGAGHLIPAFADLALTRGRVRPFLLYVPDVKVLGGTITAAGIVPAGPECGHLFEATPKRCIAGVGDPYVELSWSRYFGTPRASRYSGAYPIPEGLAVSVAFGVVIPAGKYNVNDATLQGLSIGNNLWTSRRSSASPIRPGRSSPRAPRSPGGCSGTTI
jgi:hypothetical protein